VTEDEFQEFALAFASAVVKPGGNAAYVLPNNRLETLLAEDGSEVLGEDGKPQICWQPVGLVVASSRPFIVEPCEGIVPIDGDTAEDRAWAGVARAALEPRGFRFVVTNSGGAEGRQHIFVLAPHGWSNIQTKALLESVAGDQPFQARLNNGIRPPFSLHRNGVTCSEIVEPGIATALGWFRDMQPRDLSPQMRAMLRGDDPEALVINHGKPVRGLSLQRVALGAVNSRWPFERFRAELSNPVNLTAQKWRDIELSRQSDQAVAWWDGARKYARENPVGSPNEDVRAQLRVSLAEVPAIEWSTRTGANDRAVYAALLNIGIRAATAEPGASCRQLAQAGHLHVWANVINHQVKNSPELMAFVRGRVSTPQEYAKWLAEPEQAYIRNRMRHFAHDPEDWGSRLQELYHDYLPSSELRELVRSGERITAKKLDRLFPDVSLRPVVHGQLVDANTGRALATRTLASGFNRLFKLLSEVPTDALSRHRRPSGAASTAASCRRSRTVGGFGCGGTSSRVEAARLVQKTWRL
jgi:hypothetical protein